MFPVAVGLTALLDTLSGTDERPSRPFSSHSVSTTAGLHAGYQGLSVHNIDICLTGCPARQIVVSPKYRETRLQKCAMR